MLTRARARVRRARATLASLDPRPLLTQPWPRFIGAVLIGYRVGAGRQRVPPQLERALGSLLTAMIASTVRELQARPPTPTYHA